MVNFIHRQVYNLLKQFDQEKQGINRIGDIFEPHIESLRNSIIEQSTVLIYQTEYEVIGRKCREILWFKGYYDLISIAKRLWKKNQLNDKFAEEQISNLIIEGISHFKLIIVNLERKFHLDLRNVVDFSFLDSYEKNLYTAVANETQIDCHNENRSKTEITKYAMETIHALLISLGDLHRYFIDFDFAMPKISKDFAANYYFEAFKLNPQTGMAHNQLGTLMAGSNYDLDSIYHYLYSMSCPVPFGLSDSRLAILFQHNSSYLEKQGDAANDKGDVIGLRDFIARYLLVVDVFFYDKEIGDFNSLCHCMLLDFRKMLQSTRADISSEMLYKMIAIFFFCLIKLKTIGSGKIHSLNAFLVALCAELVNACSLKLRKFIAGRQDQNEQFKVKYANDFEEFEKSVRSVREKHRQVSHRSAPSTNGANSENGEPNDRKLSDEQGAAVLKNGIKASANNMGDNNTNSSGRDRESDAGKCTPLSSQTRNKKRNDRRRRRARVSENSNSDLSYFEDSASECEMDTDFSTDIDSNDDNDDDSWGSGDSDEEEDAPKANGQNVCLIDTGFDCCCLLLDETISKLFFLFLFQNGVNDIENDSNDDDIIVEDEQLVYLENGEQNGAHRESNVFEDLMANLKKLQLFEDPVQNGTDDFTFDQTNLVSVFDFKADSGATSICNDDPNNAKAPEKLRYKQKYNKIDPNIIVEFFKYENTMVALKLLFDWLYANSAIVVNCFTTNPEFIDNIYGLLNDLNIDIFTRKVYFERRHIEIDNIRDNLRSLFDMRTAIPLKEDVLLKEFSVFDPSQRHKDWTIPLQMKITDNEETVLRIFMFVDFGFSLCKMKRFDYNFCSRTRNFIKTDGGKRTSRRVRKRGRRNGRRRGRNRDRNRRGNRNELCVLSRNGGEQFMLNKGSNDDLDRIDGDRKSNLKKGYLKNRQLTNNINNPTATAEASIERSTSKPISADEKHELMGKLWLKHEIEELETKMSKAKSVLSPYIVVDTKALTSHLEIVKKLVKARKFVVLIPNASKYYFVTTKANYLSHSD